MAGAGPIPARRSASLPVEFDGADGNRLVGTVAGGGGRVALLLHGGGQTRHAWDGSLARLAAAGWTGIAVDQRGHGDSDWPADGAYTFHDFAADAAKLARDITAQHASKPVAIGASLGGIAALLALDGNLSADAKGPSGNS
jgi:pimeloyl-ACP methyl ester carboxylesterase